MDAEELLLPPSSLLLPTAFGGSEYCILMTFQDQTPLRRVEEMRADFVANASHELRTPLAALSGFIDTLQGPAREDAKARERFLGIMHAQATRMPDEALREAADDRSVRAQLESTVMRMLQDSRSGALVDSFASQWLQLRLLDEVVECCSCERCCCDGGAGHRAGSFCSRNSGCRRDFQPEYRPGFALCPPLYPFGGGDL